MKSIFAIGIILVLSALFLLIYWSQLANPVAPETPILPGIETFRGPIASPPKNASSTPTKGFSPPTFIGPTSKPNINGPTGPPPTQ